MGEDAEYDRQIRRAEEAQGIEMTGSTTSTAGQTRSQLCFLVFVQGTGTEGDPVVEGMIENT